MNAIETEVRALIDKELAAANERFPQFHSAHEGYAVILEEFDEVREQMTAAEHYLSCLWDMVKHNSPANYQAENLMLFSSNVACEAIQVAAMCKKFFEMEKKR